MKTKKLIQQLEQQLSIAEKAGNQKRILALDKQLKRIKSNDELRKHNINAYILLSICSVFGAIIVYCYLWLFLAVAS